jgi:hypothetical protein
MTGKLCAGHIFPVNRSSNATPSYRPLPKPAFKRPAPAVNIVFSNGSFYVRSADILDIFYGGWGNEDVEEDQSSTFQ